MHSIANMYFDTKTFLITNFFIILIISQLLITFNHIILYYII